MLLLFVVLGCCDVVLLIVLLLFYALGYRTPLYCLSVDSLTYCWSCLFLLVVVFGILFDLAV